MPKLLTGIYLTIILFSCNTNIKNNLDHTKQSHITGTTFHPILQGTWVRHNKEGFTLIEIIDTSNVMYYQLMDRKFNDDTIIKDRYRFYKSNATMGYWNNSSNPYKANVDFWISTDKFRFDYIIKADTLIEFDKMGDQGKFIKVANDN